MDAEILEDLFTARLHHLIGSNSEIGQHIVEAMLLSAKKPISKFKSAVNHPNVGSENQPDFLLQCEDFDIVCEHKLLSPLGNRQLDWTLVCGLSGIDGTVQLAYVG